MLTKLSSSLSAVLLGATGLVALTPSPAVADPCPGAGVGNGGLDTCAGFEIPQPGSGGANPKRPNSGGSAPLPNINCPQVDGVVICPPGQELPGPAPHTPTVVLAGQAKAGIELPAPSIHNSPNPRTYVRVKTYLWVDQADFGTFSAEARASAGELAQVVTATARPRDVTWSMGEASIVCDGAGSPRNGDCSYTYNRSSAEQPNNAYRISATITWDVNWVCEGVGCDSGGGSLGSTTMTTTKLLSVREVQTESGARQ